MGGVLLADRGVVEVRGPEAAALLQRLFTNDVTGLAAGEARYAALLTPQGKILVDFLVDSIGQRRGGRLPARLPRRSCGRPRQEAHDVPLARPGDGGGSQQRIRRRGLLARPAHPAGTTFRDPRHEALGYRTIAERGELARLESASGLAAFHAHRIAAGVPEGGIDFAYGDTFPHEANLDRLHGLDFTKGCYVGQEVVSRVEHRGTARKRVTPVMFEGEPPPVGTDILVGEIAIGTMGSAADGRGLAMVRTDRAAEAAALGAIATANGTHLSIAIQ